MIVIKPMRTFVSLLAAGCLGTSQLAAQTPQVFTVNAHQIKTPVQKTMWGIFFEDINFGADGGIYAELVKNRSFEFGAPLMGWKELKQNNANGSLLILNRGEQFSNPRYARFTVRTAEGYGVSNEGFRGMGIRSGEQYDFSVLARTIEGNVNLRVELVNAANEKIGATSISLGGKEWKKYTGTIMATATDAKAKLNIWFEGTGMVDADIISLFPQKTWKNRPGGLRADLVQLLADMKPGFLRFPGGCIVEGRDLENRYQWKKTIGAVDDREVIINRWNTEFRHKLTPDYYQSFGLGFYEYFLLSEDIGAEPLPILNCGMACQFNTAEVVPADELDPYIQDALDLIEFANGNINSTWGKKRAELGHPNPFNLTMLGVGNENWGPQYIERLQLFTKAIKQKYPVIQLITSTGYSPNPQFKFMDSALRKLNVDIIDEHYYQTPNWFLMNAAKYDHYDRKGPKIFLGEYASQSVRIGSADNKNTLLCALGEAAFMTGLERNADIVTMAAYAPLFAHVSDWQWTPNLIWFDNARSYATPSYYVQQLFSRNRGTHVVPLLQEGAPVTGQDSCYASAVIDSAAREVILKFVNASGETKQRAIDLAGIKKQKLTGTFTILKGARPDAMNSLDQPMAIAPAVNSIELKNKGTVELAPYSVSVLRMKL